MYEGHSEKIKMKILFVIFIFMVVIALIINSIKLYLEFKNIGENMLKTIHIKTKSLEENGSTASWLSNNKANIKIIVDGEALAKEIEEQGNLLIKEGYQILSILPITSQKIETHSLSATFTSSVVITAIKTN